MSKTTTGNSNVRKIRIGKQVTIPAGTRVTRQGETTKRGRPTNVTVRNVETTRNGAQKIYWKSNGYRAYATLK